MDGCHPVRVEYGICSVYAQDGQEAVESFNSFGIRLSDHHICLSLNLLFGQINQVFSGYDINGSVFVVRAILSKEDFPE